MRRFVIIVIGLLALFTLINAYTRESIKKVENERLQEIERIKVNP